MKVTQISYDPEARTVLERTKAPYDFQSCKECGKRAKFVYRNADANSTVPPAHSTQPWSQPFCSITCYRSYNGMIRFY